MGDEHHAAVDIDLEAVAEPIFEIKLICGILDQRPRPKRRLPRKDKQCDAEGLGKSEDRGRSSRRSKSPNMVRKFSPEKPYKKAVESFFEETAKEEKSCTSSPVLEEIRDDKSQAQQEPQGEERDDEKKRKKERPPKSMPMFHLFQTVHERGLAMLSMRIVSDVFFAICRHKFSESFRRSFGIDIVY